MRGGKEEAEEAKVTGMGRPMHHNLVSSNLLLPLPGFFCIVLLFSEGGQTRPRSLPFLFSPPLDQERIVVGEMGGKGGGAGRKGRARPLDAPPREQTGRGVWGKEGGGKGLG